MNYACISNQPVTTSKSKLPKTCLSLDAKERREFIRNHNFSIYVNPSTKKAEVKITER